MPSGRQPETSVKKVDIIFDDHAQQPPDVVSGRAKYCVQTAALRTLEVANDGLDRLATFE